MGLESRPSSSSEATRPSSSRVRDCLHAAEQYREQRVLPLPLGPITPTPAARHADARAGERHWRAKRVSRGTPPSNAAFSSTGGGFRYFQTSSQTTLASYQFADTRCKFAMHQPDDGCRGDANPAA